MTTLLLVRHGETFDNAAHLMQGQVQGQLNETGIAQAEGVRDQMAGEHIDAFVSSDLHRSVQTCEIIAEPHHKPVVQTPLLRERDWGSFTGKYIPDLQARAKKFLDWIRAQYPDQTVLAVGHGIVNKAIQSVYTGKPMNQIQRMENAEVRRLEL